MATSTCFLIFFSFILLSSSATAFNITRILGTYSDYSVFNGFLTQTGLNTQINSRSTITVLTVSNDQMQPLQGKSNDVLKKVMGLHVILDYYDPKKLNNLKKSTLLTTLYQTSGDADANEGFVNATVIQGEVKLGSGVKGSPLSSQVVKSVVAQPFNISVLEISSPIIPPSVMNGTSTSKAPASAPKRSPTPSKAPAPAPRKARAKSPTPTPSDAPVADAPVADAPDADAPTADAPAPADGPAADAPGGAADASPKADKKSSGTTVAPGLVSALMFIGFFSLVRFQ